MKIISSAFYLTVRETRNGVGDWNPYVVIDVFTVTTVIKLLVLYYTNMYQTNILSITKLTYLMSFIILQF